MANPKIPSDFRPLGAAGGLKRYEYAQAVFALPQAEVMMVESGFIKVEPAGLGRRRL